MDGNESVDQVEFPPSPFRQEVPIEVFEKIGNIRADVEAAKSIFSAFSERPLIAIC